MVKVFNDPSCHRHYHIDNNDDSDEGSDDEQ
jgi:hypothetical protein